MEILELEGTKLEIDKDILTHKVAKFYSDKVCTLVPVNINNAVRSVIKKDSYLPQGVNLQVGRGKGVQTQVHQFGKVYYLKRSFQVINSLEDADYYRDIIKQYKYKNKFSEEKWAAIGYCFLWYKERKESEIKRLAEYWYNYKYEGKIYHCITKECYDVLMNWTIDIND